jgi:hypothetical protein
LDHIALERISAGCFVDDLLPMTGFRSLIDRSSSLVRCFSSLSLALPMPPPMLLLLLLLAIVSLVVAVNGDRSQV